MRYGFIHIAVFALLVGVSFNSCRAKKDFERNTQISERTERTERSVDSTRNTETEHEKTERIGLTEDNFYIRTTEYDPEGRIRSISETWRDRRHSDMAYEERSKESVSLSGSEKEIVEADTSTVITNETLETTNDSRPVQGFEWFWTVASGVLILSLIIYQLINKKNKWL
ncbi:MAG: hypothetical protein PHV53_11565 [Fermentimonas sp.]|nr:hypothetical protein [Fermentimonas sp.]